MKSLKEREAVGDTEEVCVGTRVLDVPSVTEAVIALIVSDSDVDIDSRSV